MSYYRAYRVDTLEEWEAKLDEIRTLANIRPEDHCVYDNSNQPVNPPRTCAEHFMLEDYAA